MKKTKTYLLFIIFFFWINNVYSQVLFDWQKWYTSTGAKTDYGLAVQSDDSNFVYVGGVSDRPGNNFTILIKYKPNGDSVWVRQFSFSNRDAGFGDLYADNQGNIYISGFPTIMKYNSNGQLLWYRADSANNWAITGSKLKYDSKGFLYTGGYSAYSDSLFESVAIGKYEPVNGELIWRKFHSSSGGVRMTDMILDKNDNIIICGYIPEPDRHFVTFKYDKNGNFKWSRVSHSPDPVDPFAEAFAVAVDDTGNVYVTGRSDTTSGQTTYLTIKYDTAGTANWTRRFAVGGSGSSGHDIDVDKQGYVYVTGQTGTNITTLKYSNDGTLLWQKTIPGNTILPTFPMQEMDTSGNIYVTTFAGTGSSVTYLVRKYNSNGDSVWTFRKPQPWINSEDPDAMFVDKKGNIYITGQGIGSGIGGGENIFTVKLSQPISGITNISNEVPGNFSLSQNYPNPFNPTTKIRFRVSHYGFIKLAVYDLLGREVALLVNENLIAGTYEYTFDASNLSSGIYYYRLTSDNFSDTKKLVVLK